MSSRVSFILFDVAKLRKIFLKSRGKENFLQKNELRENAARWKNNQLVVV